MQEKVLKNTSYDLTCLYYYSNNICVWSLVVGQLVNTRHSQEKKDYRTQFGGEGSAERCKEKVERSINFGHSFTVNLSRIGLLTYKYRSWPQQ